MAIAPSCADADHADGLAGLDARALERLQHDRAWLHEHRRVERHMLGKRMHDARRDDDELAVAAAAREADRVVGRAQMRVSGATARAAETGDVALAHDALALLEAGHALADGFDHAAPLVARNDREAHPARVESSRHDVEIGAADTGP